MASVGTLWTVVDPTTCSRFLKALVPNIGLSIFVPDRDCDGQTFPQLAHVASLHALFDELCGGHAPPATGPGHYRGSAEHTIVVMAYLPGAVTEAVRRRLLAAILGFGVQARQREVLAIVGVYAHRFRFEVDPVEVRNSVVPTAEVA